MNHVRPFFPIRSPSLRAAADWLLAATDLVFPPRCVFCGIDVDDAEVVEVTASIVCDGCTSEIAGDDPPRCDLCGGVTERVGCCGTCRPRPWRSIAVLGGYDGPLREAVLRAKRIHGVDACRGLASLWLHRHGSAAKLWGCDRVVPVPLHWTRRLVRGTSAAETLATSVARGLGLPLSRSLRRKRRTRMQNELPPEDRGRNVRAAFRCRSRIPGVGVLLVDDVVTTGATIVECSRELLAAGAGRVFVAAMAKADRGGESCGSDAR